MSKLTNMHKLLLIFCLGHFQTVIAGNEIGNGGDIVICQNSSSSSSTEMKLLDFVEAKILSRHEIIEINEPKDPYELAKTKFEKLGRIDEKLSKQYTQNLKDIRQKLLFLSSSSLKDIQDSHEIALPKNCHIKQIAINVKDAITQKQVIHIDENLWKNLNVNQQAGLITHEIIYEHFMYLGEKDSRKARYFNAFLFSKEMNQMNKEQYRLMLQGLRIPIYL